MSASPSSNSVSFSLGSDAMLRPLFPYLPKSTTLADCIAHSINQTLLRDLCYGAWAHVQSTADAKKVLQYTVKISSPDTRTDLSPYRKLIPGFLAVASAALGNYNLKLHTIKPAPTGIGFLPPFGLAMANMTSVQLLHYPPTETLNYIDYLYSPTNRRWENLLGYNGHPGASNTLVESIIDLLPIAADGGASGALALQAFDPQPASGSKPAPTPVFKTYIDQMMQLYLRVTPSKKATQPVVAYGGPVMNYLQQVYNPTDLSTKITGNKTTASGSLWPLSLVSLQLVKSGPKTSVLCANHPAQFMYYDPSKKNDPKVGLKHFMTVLQQDLIAAGWQSQMSQTPDADPLKTLGALYTKWTSPANQKQVTAIFNEQVSEFGQ